MHSTQVFFSIFDTHQGPIPIYSTGEENQSLAQKIALKSHLTLAMTEGLEFQATDAILPLPGLGKIAYVFLFSTKSPQSVSLPGHNQFIASLSYVVDNSDEMELYSQINVLKDQAGQISKAIINHILQNKGESFTITKELEMQIAAFGSHEKTESELYEDDMEVKASYNQEGVNSSISFLFRAIKKNLEAAIYAVLTEKPVVVFGHKLLIPLVVRSLDLFTLFPPKNRIEYSESYVDPERVNILGISNDLIKLYDSKQEVIIDLDKRSVEGENKSKFIKAWMKTLRKSKTEDKMQENMRKILNRIRKAVTDLPQILNMIDKKLIQKYLQNFSIEEKDLILRLGSHYYPKLSSHIDKILIAIYIPGSLY